MEKQRCSVCHEEKPLTEFHKQKSRKNGVMSRCKKCNSLIAKQWSKENKEKINKKQREKYKKFSNEKKQQRLADNRRYYNRNIEKMRERVNTYRKNNPKQKSFSEARRRTKKQNNGIFQILPKELYKILSMPCQNCGTEENITLDHIIPVSRGGRHSIGNLQSLCRSCNSSKNNKLLIEWRAYQRNLV